MQTSNKDLPAEGKAKPSSDALSGTDKPPWNSYEKEMFAKLKEVEDERTKEIQKLGKIISSITTVIYCSVILTFPVLLGLALEWVVGKLDMPQRSLETARFTIGLGYTSIWIWGFPLFLNRWMTMTTLMKTFTDEMSEKEGDKDENIEEKESTGSESRGSSYESEEEEERGGGDIQDRNTRSDLERVEVVKQEAEREPVVEVEPATVVEKKVEQATVVEQEVEPATVVEKKVEPVEELAQEVGLTAGVEKEAEQRDVVKQEAGQVEDRDLSTGGDKEETGGEPILVE